MKETIYNNLLKNINITVARKINEQKAKIFNAIPFKENEKEVYVYCSEVNKKVEEDMLFIFRKKVILILIKKEEIQYLIKIAYLGQKKEAYDIIIKEAIKLNVSDIHYEPYKDYVVVRFRIDGLLRSMYIFNKEEYQLILSK